MSRRTAPPNHIYIDTAPALARLVAELGRVERVAIDTEADSLHHYYEKVCLIQLSFGSASFIVDPLAAIDLGPLLDTLAKRVLIFHGGEYDLRMMLGSFGFRPRGEVFDTMLAAQLVGSRELSLVALAENHLGVRLTKQGQRSDWSARPLKPEQLAYAVDDTRYLETLAERLTDELRRLGRLEWHRQSCARMVTFAQQQKPPAAPERVWRIKGCRELTPRQLAFVRALWHWREQEAQLADLPPFKVVGNETLLAVAIAAAAAKSGLGEKVKLPRTCTGRRLAALREAVASVRTMPESEWPRHLRSIGARVEYGPELDKLRAECNRIAESLSLDPSLIAPRHTLEVISLRKPATLDQVQQAGDLLPWQLELIGPAALRILSGS